MSFCLVQYTIIDPETMETNNMDECIKIRCYIYIHWTWDI